MDDKIIRFPTGKTADAKPGAADAPRDGASAPVATDGLNEDQRKAIGIVLSGMSFVMVGIKPTERGADFFTVVTGDAADLRNAQTHLPGTIDKAYARKGL